MSRPDAWFALALLAFWCLVGIDSELRRIRRLLERDRDRRPTREPKDA